MGILRWFKNLFHSKPDSISTTNNEEEETMIHVLEEPIDTSDIFAKNYILLIDFCRKYRDMLLDSGKIMIPQAELKEIANRLSFYYFARFLNRDNYHWMYDFVTLIQIMENDFGFENGIENYVFYENSDNSNRIYFNFTTNEVARLNTFKLKSEVKKEENLLEEFVNTGLFIQEKEYIEITIKDELGGDEGQRIYHSADTSLAKRNDQAIFLDMFQIQANRCIRIMYDYLLRLCILQYFGVKDADKIAKADVEKEGLKEWIINMLIPVVNNNGEC